MNKRYIPIIVLLIFMVALIAGCTKENESNIAETSAVITEKESKEANTLSSLGNLNAFSGAALSLTNTSTNEATYKVTYVDQMNNPIEGVNLQICSENICYVFVSDENGVCENKLPASEYEVHTLIVPAGYSYSSQEVLSISSLGCDITIVLEKN